jgi:hypothetical protein
MDQLGMFTRLQYETDLEAARHALVRDRETIRSPQPWRSGAISRAKRWMRSARSGLA